ncbi:MAG: hypothetical protein HY020_01210 [Burkholderiales bacterium]|nr:hypothetical protein [Burkholderiales bacterium]
MATIANRSRFCVKNVDEATRYFSYDQLEAVEAYMQELRAQNKYKPKVKQLDETWLFRVRTKGQKDQTATFPSSSRPQSS